LRPVALDAEVNQARFFAAGDDLDGRATASDARARKSLLVAGIGE